MGSAMMGSHCRSTASLAIKAFAEALEEQAVGGRVSVSTIRRLSEVLSQVPGPLAAHYAIAEQTCVSNFAMQQMDLQRTNYVGRIAVKTFSHLLLDPSSGIGRKHLTPFFSALRMILGEEIHDSLQEKCAAVVAQLSETSGVTPWEEFYAHPEVVRITEIVLVSMAKALRRFEPRKDWLLIVMNSNPTSQSTGSTAFIARTGPSSKTVQGFNEANLMVLLDAMFSSVRPSAMNDEAKVAFRARWGLGVEEMFGPLFVEITMWKYHRPVSAPMLQEAARA